MFKNFPSLHPLVVHFPIVLILLAAAFQAAVVWKNWNQIRWATLFIMGAAFLSALAASTIFHAMPSNDAPQAAMTVFAVHEKYAQYTLWVSGIVLLLKGIGDFYKINRKSYDVAVLAAALTTALFVSVAGHHGAILTHIHGVGPQGRYLMKGHGDEDMEMDSMDMQGHGGDANINNRPQTDSTNQAHDMKTMGDPKSTQGAHDMKNMGDPKSTQGAHDMKNMGDMNMPTSAMDTLRFPDNNPARKKSKKPNKQ